jgi:LuxR family glucitol operon transcriptional activator
MVLFMSSKVFATRMTCFSLVSAIETDLRSVISLINTEIKLTIPNDVKDNSSKRFKEHHNEVYNESDPLGDLIEFSDFSDLSKIFSKNKNIQSTFLKDELDFIISGLIDLTSARNRVCHSRPLESNDINDFTDFSVELKKKGKNNWWGNINEALNNLNNPSFALSLKIPTYWVNKTNSIYNNLPLPEFDDTGFLGRSEDRKAINELIYSHTRVISIIGEGGVGKTALALRCLYDVLDASEVTENHAFGMIIWVTLKANKLTSSGVVQLRDAIVTSLGLYQSIGNTAGAENSSSIDELLEEIAIYMKEFKILLCIDNLETIQKQSVRKFLADIPEGSKILITTRIGLGEIEYRYKLDSLDEKSSINLIRKLSRLLNIQELLKKNNESLKQLSIRLFNNPLLIKWYVLSISNGKRQGELINKDALSYKEALKFCFENLYDRLSSNELEVIKTVACMRKNVSAVELRFILSHIDEFELEEALHCLNNSSMLKSNIDPLDDNDESKTYTLTDIAGGYLNSVRPVDDEFFAMVKSKNRELRKHLEESLSAHNHYHLDVTCIHASTKDEKICAVYLKRALGLARNKDDLPAALELVKQAKSMMPSFSECYRIHAYLLHNSPYKAESEYESAIEYNNESLIAYYAFSQFLLHEEEFENALTQINIAIKLDNDEALLSFKALVLTRTGDYPNAIDIYEKILPSQKDNPHRKFRISTYQQIISCYRRFSESLIADRDFNGASCKIKRCISILEDALNTDNFDDRTIQVCGKILTDSDKIDFQNGGTTLTSSLLDIFDRYLDIFSYHNKVKLSQIIQSSIEWLVSSNKVRVKSLLEKLNKQEQGDTTLFHGTIKSVVSNNGVDASFGFITGDDAEEYFFHRGEINPVDIFDNIDEARGTRVAFIPFKNYKGLNANNVHLI